MLARHFLELPLNATAVLPWASLMSLAYMTVPVPECLGIKISFDIYCVSYYL